MFPFQVLCVEYSAANPFIGSHGQQGSVGPISRSPPHLLCISLPAFPARCKDRPSRRVLTLYTLLLLVQVIGLSQHTSLRSCRLTSLWAAIREHSIERLNKIIPIVNSSNKTIKSHLYYLYRLFSLTQRTLALALHSLNVDLQTHADLLVLSSGRREPK